MSLILLTGVTGAGKSHKAVSLIMESLNKGRNVFTNIKIFIEHENYNYIDELGVRDFITFIDDTFRLVDNLEDKKAFMRTTKYFDTDFYIDESHLVGFDKKTQGILNWMTLQRHFFQNITLITQLPSNLHRDYLRFFHGHIDMINPKKRLIKESFGLREYESYGGDRLRTSYYKPDLSIFEMYNSGAIESGSNKDILKLGLLVMGLLLFAVALFFMLSSLFKTPEVPTENNVTDFKLDNKVNKFGTGEDIDSNETNLPTTYNVWCDTSKGCYVNGEQYSFFRFQAEYLTKNKNIGFETVLKKDDWKMIKYTFNI